MINITFYQSTIFEYQIYSNEHIRNILKYYIHINDMKNEFTFQKHIFHKKIDIYLYL